MNARVLFLVAFLPVTVAAADPPAAPREAEPFVRADDVDELEKELRSADKWTRKSAVEKAARLGTAEAWALVIEALGDERGEVADTAQYLLGGLDQRDLLDALVGEQGLKAKDEWVRLRAAEVLGRATRPVSGAALARLFSQKDPRLRRTVAWSLERLGRASLVDGEGDKVRSALAKASERDRDAGVRARAYLARAAFDPATARDACDAALEAKEPEVRCAAAVLAPRVHEPAAAVARLRRLGADPAWSVRTHVVDGLSRLGTRAAVRALVDLLGVEGEMRLQWRLVFELRALSGKKYGVDARPWMRWAQELPEDWVAPTPSERALASMEQDEKGDGDRSATFVGLPIRSKRLTFLIDLSGSIWKERADGRTRKSVVDERLREVLEALPADTRFNVIAYTEKPIPWKGELVEATPKNVKKAASFEKRSDSGTGNFWDAAMLALEDPEVDTLVVLTDGAPTGGRRFRLELMIDLYVELFLTRPVAVDSVIVDAGGRIERFWSDWARRTGGSSVNYSLK